MRYRWLGRSWSTLRAASPIKQMTFSDDIPALSRCYTSDRLGHHWLGSRRCSLRRRDVPSGNESSGDSGCWRDPCDLGQPSSAWRYPHRDAPVEHRWARHSGEEPRGPQGSDPRRACRQPGEPAASCPRTRYVGNHPCHVSGCRASARPHAAHTGGVSDVDPSPLMVLKTRWVMY